MKEKILERIKKLVNLPNKTIEDLEYCVDEILDIVESKKTNITNLEKFIEEQSKVKPSSYDRAAMKYLFIELAKALNNDLNHKNVAITNEKSVKTPKIYKAVRRVERIGEVIPGEGLFFEIIVLHDENGKIVTKSNRTHPESYFTFIYNGVEYFSLPDSKGEKPVYCRMI